MVLSAPETGANSKLFFLQLEGTGWVWYWVIIATLATVFASQAMISGVFATLHQVCVVIYVDIYQLFLILRCDAVRYG